MFGLATGESSGVVESQNKRVKRQNFTPLLGRILLSAIFLKAGVDKIIAPVWHHGIYG